MDIYKREFRDTEFNKRKLDLINHIKHLNINLVFKQTSIWEETLYIAWSEILIDMIKNYKDIENRLRLLAESSKIDELIMFEKNTFLKVCHINVNSEQNMDPLRFEKTSNLIKHFKLVCKNVDFAVDELEYHGINING